MPIGRRLYADDDYGGDGCSIVVGGGDDDDMMTTTKKLYMSFCSPRSLITCQTNMSKLNCFTFYHYNSITYFFCIYYVHLLSLLFNCGIQ